MSGQSYTLRFKNRSESQHDFLIYQQSAGTTQSNSYTLAWFVKPIGNGVDLDVTWTFDYDFIWFEQGTKNSGIQFLAQQVLPADLTDKNEVDFTLQDGAFQFVNESGGGTPGSLTIKADSTIPQNMAKIGIGMSGSGTQAINAQPNFAAMFTPRPAYWIAYGSFVQGQVLDTQTLVNAAEVQFPVNVYGMTATLDSGNTWTIVPGLN